DRDLLPPFASVDEGIFTGWVSGLNHRQLRVSSAGLLPAVERGFEFGQDLEQVTDQPVIRNLEYGRFLILIDRNDDARVFHAREVLDRTRDAHGNVEIGRDDLARLTNLIVVWNKAGINGSPARADRCAEPIGNPLQKLE